MKKLLYISLVLLMGAMFMQCSDDKDPAPQKNEAPIESVYKEVVPKEFLDLITSSCDGAKSYTETDPPLGVLDKTIWIKEEYLNCSNTFEIAGTKFVGEILTISEYDPATSRCVLEIFTETYSESTVAYLLGDGNEFAVFANLNSTDDGVTAKFLYWYTGTYTPDGIKGLKLYLQSVEVPEEAKDRFLEEGKYRGIVHNFEDNANSIAPFISFTDRQSAINTIRNQRLNFGRSIYMPEKP